MGVFHVFLIVPMVPNHAKHHNIITLMTMWKIPNLKNHEKQKYMLTSEGEKKHFLLKQKKLINLKPCQNK